MCLLEWGENHAKPYHKYSSMSIMKTAMNAPSKISLDRVADLTRKVAAKTVGRLTAPHAGRCLAHAWAHFGRSSLVWATRPECSGLRKPFENQNFPFTRKWRNWQTRRA